MIRVYVIPTRDGRWAVRRWKRKTFRRWYALYREWWEEKGHRLAISPEMWIP